MTVEKLLKAGITIASLTVVGGAIAKKPLLFYAGANLGISTGACQLVIKQNRQKQLAATSIQPDLSAIEAILEKHQKQLKEQRTKQNLTLSKVSKLDHKQKVTAIAISKQVDKLVDLAESNTVKKSTKVTQIKKPVKLTPIRQPATRVYVDGNNLSCAAKEMDIDVDYKALRLYLMGKGKSEFSYYRGVAQNPTVAHQRFVGSLEKYGYRVTELPVVRFADGTVKTVGDDMAMGIDILEENQQGDRVVLVTGDGDFIPVVKRIQERGVKVTVVGRKANTSAELRCLADDYLDLETIKYQIAVHTKLTLV